MLNGRTRFALWLRRPSSWVEIVAWAALVAFVACTIGPALIGQGTFLNTGMLSRYTPWGESLETLRNSTNILSSDTLDSVTPQTTLLVKLAHEGVFGSWNPARRRGRRTRRRAELRGVVPAVAPLVDPAVLGRGRRGETPRDRRDHGRHVPAAASVGRPAGRVADRLARLRVVRLHGRVVELAADPGGRLPAAAVLGHRPGRRRAPCTRPVQRRPRRRRDAARGLPGDRRLRALRRWPLLPGPHDRGPPRTPPGARQCGDRPRRDRPRCPARRLATRALRDQRRERRRLRRSRSSAAVPASGPRPW
ncbi:hypothetical protein Q9Q99_05955 [Curtobacterium flaccumfaciens]|nr:hypothetical protein Q9Q99_05955 [Curtobacterium flaccumfaciens]